jgi:hypothetical protein
MKYPKDAVRLFSVIVSFMILFVIIGCGDDGGGGPSGPKLPADPGPGNLAGVIVGTINGRALVGVTVSVGSISTSTDSDGIFRLDGVGEGVLAVMIEGGDVYTRRAAVDTAAGRSVLLDAIEVNSGFNLGFYREIARGNHPDEGELHPIRRWINPTPPTVYIDTDASATLDGFIDRDQINAVRAVITKMFPIWSGNFYSSVSIKTRAFTTINDFGDIPDNSFVISFDDSLYLSLGALGVTISEQGFIINKVVIFLLDTNLFYSLSNVTLEQVASHELGHGFGFEHTSLLSSIMPVSPPLPSGLYTNADKLHAAVMYRRPAGNTDIDNDPVPGAKIIGEAPGIKIHVDKAPNPPELSTELRKQLQSLRSHDMVKKYLNR